MFPHDVDATTIRGKPSIPGRRKRDLSSVYTVGREEGMLKRIEKVNSVGLLRNANGAGFEFHKATLIYADNGRGKSTLASILRSCSLGQASIVADRQTIDDASPQEIVLQFENGVKVTFSGGAWNAYRSELLVFDTDFVDQNVYSGTHVSPEHRRGLLEFALGQQAVLAKQEVDAATQLARKASEDASAAEAALKGFHQGITIASFESLPPNPTADQEIDSLRKRIVAAGSTATLQSKAVPQAVIEPTLDLTAFFNILGTTLQNIEVDSEKKVQEHIAKHGGSVAEGWISQGFAMQIDKECPFCALPTAGNPLIESYRSYFNAAYNKLKADVGALAQKVELSVVDAVVDRFFSGIETAQAIADGWAEHVPSTKLEFDKEEARVLLDKLRERLSVLAKAKEQSPLDKVGKDEDRTIAAALWQELVERMRSVNKAILKTAVGINEFKVKLAKENVPQLQQQIIGLELVKKRHDPKVATLIEKWKSEKKNREAADKKKTEAREKLDALMKATLNKYQTAINGLLKDFGASFEITQMDFNYYGGVNPRTDYALRLRGKNVQLTGGVPTFGTALSDGDRRTLAFAFFIASVLADPKLSDKVIVIDDPMSSLDRNRRHQTRQVLKNISASAKQLIVMAHDVYFLRDLRNDLSAKGAPPPPTLKLVRVKNDYTDFAKAELDKECESDYYYHHRILRELVDGTYVGDSRTVAKAIRPMLEGYLHRRFPGRINRGLLFGEIVGLIKSAQPGDPLIHLKPMVTEMNTINSYAGQFHHDTNAAADSAPVDDTEIKNYADRALTLIYRGS